MSDDIVVTASPYGTPRFNNYLSFQGWNYYERLRPWSFNHDAGGDDIIISAKPIPKVVKPLEFQGSLLRNAFTDIAEDFSTPQSFDAGKIPATTKALALSDALAK